MCSAAPDTNRGIVGYRTSMTTFWRAGIILKFIKICPSHISSWRIVPVGSSIYCYLVSIFRRGITSRTACIGSNDKISIVDILTTVCQFVMECKVFIKNWSPISRFIRMNDKFHSACSLRRCCPWILWLPVAILPNPYFMKLHRCSGIFIIHTSGRYGCLIFNCLIQLGFCSCFPDIIRQFHSIRKCNSLSWCHRSNIPL